MQNIFSSVKEVIDMIKDKQEKQEREFKERVEKREFVNKAKIFGLPAAILRICKEQKSKKEKTVKPFDFLAALTSRTVSTGVPEGNCNANNSAKKGYKIKVNQMPKINTLITSTNEENSEVKTSKSAVKSIKLTLPKMKSIVMLQKKMQHSNTSRLSPSNKKMQHTHTSLFGPSQSTFKS